MASAIFLFIFPLLFALSSAHDDNHFSTGFSSGAAFSGHHGIEFATSQQTAAVAQPQQAAKPNIETDFLGQWKIDNKNAGVAAMQLQLMPNGKVVWFDTTNLGPSAVLNKPPWCRPIPNDKDKKLDCFAHGIEYDPDTSKFRTLRFDSDPWCSCGGLTPNGDLIITGGAIEGMRSVRLLRLGVPNAQPEEARVALAGDRWYPSQTMLEDGNFIVVGGRKSFTYELVPSTNSLHFTPKIFNLPLLQQTNDPVENNLYPFVYLLPTGMVYLFANYKSIIINPQTGQIIKALPDLDGSRNYPPSAMSALLPLVPGPTNTDQLPAEVIICGGNTRDAAKYSQWPPRKFYPALDDCNRMVVTDPNPVWDKEVMPSKRCMGDMLYLPTGDLLMLHGAEAGTSAWEAADDPNFTPVLYSPYKPKGQRFKELTPTQIARMYHSASALLPNGKILVAGSNPNQFYNFTVKFPTELRVEKFTPPYLAPGLNKYRPKIDRKFANTQLKYGQPFDVKINLKEQFGLADVKVHMIPPPFTTHGWSQNQRLIVVTLKNVAGKVISGLAPPSSKIAPPGYYMLFAVYRGVPSPGAWVQLS